MRSTLAVAVAVLLIGVVGFLRSNAPARVDLAVSEEGVWLTLVNLVLTIFGALMVWVGDRRAHQDRRLAFVQKAYDDYQAIGHETQVLWAVIFSPAAVILRKRGHQAYLAWMRMFAEVLAGKEDGEKLAAKPAAYGLTSEFQGPLHARYVGDEHAFGLVHARYKVAAAERLKQERTLSSDRVSEADPDSVSLSYCRRVVALNYEFAASLAVKNNFVSGDPVFRAADIDRMFHTGDTVFHLLVLTLHYRAQLRSLTAPGLPAATYNLHALRTKEATDAVFEGCLHDDARRKLEDWLKLDSKAIREGYDYAIPDGR